MRLPHVFMAVRKYGQEEEVDESTISTSREYSARIAHEDDKHYAHRAERFPVMRIERFKLEREGKEE